MRNSVRFTDRASSAIKAARDAAASLGHSYVARSICCSAWPQRRTGWARASSHPSA